LALTHHEEHTAKSIQWLDIFGVTAFAALALGGAWRIHGSLGSGDVWLVSAALVLGWLAADFISGFVHWMGDTWGSVNMPVLGKAFIHPFREHHVDPKAITRHNFLETNGNNCLVSLPALLPVVFIPIGPDAFGHLFLAMCVFAMTIWVLLTNQIHKWAHMDTPPKWVKAMQKARLFLDPGHHGIHHTAPYDTHYCITTGAWNPLLARIRFFRHVERLVTRLTGLVPRREDADLTKLSAGARLAGQ
jgi:plasmanylethanolamine desaturase